MARHHKLLCLLMGLAWLMGTSCQSTPIRGDSDDAMSATRGDERGRRAPGAGVLSLDDMQAEARVALVIGNGAYEEGPLRNPPNDAALMGEALREVGFELVGGKAHVNQTRDQMQELVIDFGKRLRETGGVGVFYFAGHGWQVKGENYLVPVGDAVVREEYLKVRAVAVGEVLAEMEAAKNRLNLVILDACRINPFEQGSRASARGLAQMSAPSGTMVLYATKPGEVAYDGEGTKNGPFTRALVEQMKRPQKLEDVIKRAVIEVEAETEARQTPWSEGVIRGDFYFRIPEGDELCSEGMAWDGRGCVAKVSTACPPGTEFEVGRGCVAKVSTECPGGTKFIEGRGCVAHVVEPERPAREKETPRVEPRVEPRIEPTPRVGDPAGMVKIPAGKFWMGSTDDRSNEKPRREVYVDGFWMDVYEVTVGDYRECVKAGECSAPGTRSKYCNWKYKDREKHPVNCVIWKQADAYCQWLDKRLPTEAQWEKAARGVDGRTYPWGEEKPTCEHAVMDEGGGGCGEKRTWEVGSKPKGVSPYGVHDMSGNVWEWVEDWYDSEFYSKATERNPVNTNAGLFRVSRGGSWLNDGDDLRAANRAYSLPEDNLNYLGFRCARSFN